MQLLINCVEANKIFSCKKDTEDVIKHIELVNPQYLNGSVLFDILVHLPDSFTIGSRLDGLEEYVTITLNKLGSFELNTKDFRDITLLQKGEDVTKMLQQLSQGLLHIPGDITEV